MEIGDLRYKPTGYSYRVDESIWAGEYPVWEWDRTIRQRQLKLYTDFGISIFVDLTEEGEMPPYSCFLTGNIHRYAFPIKNGSVPDDIDGLSHLLHVISEKRQESPDSKIYIHCVGGVGRTGMIVACYYIYFYGISADESMALLRQRFAYHGRSAWMQTPETAEQEEFIRKFAATCRFL